MKFSNAGLAMKLKGMAGTMAQGSEMRTQPSNAQPPSPAPPDGERELLDAPVRRAPMFTPEELDAFKVRVSPLIGLDLLAYKPRQVERRVAVLMSRAGAPTLEALHQRLVESPTQREAFVNGLMINVTEFFRNPEQFEALAATILPMLLARFDRLKVWSAGCSGGAEPYTVGMMLERLGALDRAELVGTDLDREALERARAGLFSENEIQGLSEALLAERFVREGRGYRFKGSAIMARTRLERQNLLEAPPERGCHLVLCRNVAIYLNQESKHRLYRAFHEALVPGGVLFIGSTERIFDARDMGFEPVAPFFYQKQH